MKEVLPIIFGLVWLGFSLYSKNVKKAAKAEKKKAQMAQSQGQQSENKPVNKSPESLEDMVELLFKQNKKPQYSESMVEDHYPDSIETDYEFVESRPTSFQEVGVEESTERAHDRSPQNSEQNKTLDTNKPIDLEKDTVENSPILEDIDLEKMIIYDAILNRPYS